MKNIIKKIQNYYKTYGLKETLKWFYNCVKVKIFNNKYLKMEFDKFYITNNEKENMILKGKANIYIFATVPFYDVGGGQRSAQFTKIFNKMGYKVNYIYAFKSSEAKQIFMSIPSVKHVYIDNYNVNDFEMQLNKNDMVIFEAPCDKFDSFLNIAYKKKSKIIYENIDNWESNLGNILYNENTLKNMLKKASFLVGTANPLVDQLNNYLKKYKIKQKEILYLPNAVDDELFNPNKTYKIPNDMIKGDKTLLYYGSLWGKWFDWGLLFDVAIKNPTYSILLIGDYSGILDKVKTAPSNISFLGMKRQDELPAYLYYSDYAILPFKVDQIGKYVSPLKMFEYIAMNKKILATSLPDIINYPNVNCGDTAESWNKYLMEDLESKDYECQFFVAENNWYDRCVKLIEYANLENNKKCSESFYNNISIIILNYNNDKVIFRCIDSLEKFIERYNYEIIIVDNQSTDGSYEKLVKEYKNLKNIKIIRNTKNGCSSGRNLGVKNSTKDYIMFLDSDEWILNKYWLDNYIDIMENNSNVGAIGWGAGWFNNKGFAYHVVDSFAYRYMPPCSVARKDIGYLATCGFIISKKLFEEIEGFDEAYDPTCYEDTDLSLKVRNAGKEIYYSPNLGVGHLPHQTTKSGSSAHEKLIHEKGMYFIKKWSAINKNLIYKYKK